MAQADSMYSAVFFINPSFPSTGRSSITNLQTSPLATPNLSFLFFLYVHGFCLFFFSLTSFRYFTIYLTLSLSSLLSLSAYVSSFFCINQSLPLSFSSSLLSVPIQSPAHVDLIPLSYRADCNETSCIL